MNEIKEADHWLESAKNLMKTPTKDREKYTVITAQCIHSIIRANDALATRFLKKRAIRHDDAPRLFLELIENNKIPQTHAKHRKTITDAVLLKSRVDYKGTEISKKEAERWIKKTEKFLEIAKESLKP